MRHVQDVALSAFIARGYEAVTVEEVAREAGVGVASIFRNFGSKERLVLWDEYDPLLFARLARHLEHRAPLEALTVALDEALGEIYERDRRRVLRRTDLVAKTPALVAASRAELAALRGGLTTALTPAVRDPLRRELLAAVFTATLEVCVERWRRERGKRPLGLLLRAAFRDVARLG